ncbi:MAG: hypothetical protein ACI86X_000256 [Moritella sp.]|jgi:hypothetical protein
MDRTSTIFGNKQSTSTVKKAQKAKTKYLKKFGDDSHASYPLTSFPNPVLEPYLGVKNINISEQGDPLDTEKGIIVGNIRMGYGHYRISMAIASAANHLGYTPYWLDLNAYQQTTGGKVINHLNNLYSLGSRLSQKYPLFNKLYWDKLNSEGFRKLSYNAMDQKVSELMAPVLNNLPKDLPFIATHAWPAQAAVHANMQNVINVIPDNWPMALHLSEGAKHVVQTPSSYFGYRMLKGMDGTKTLKPMPAGSIENVGHFIDHELLMDLEGDCQKRIDRLHNQAPRRILLTIGGAGAQFEIYKAIIIYLLPLIVQKKVCLLINVGDYKNVWLDLISALPDLKEMAHLYDDDWSGIQSFTNSAMKTNVEGVYAFHNKEIFSAVYTTNLLMRITDVMVTKPSELSFYPVPKLLIKRVGGHEAYGALRAAEIGDGTIEFENTSSAIQMLKLMIDETDIIEMMCSNIIKAKNAGVYDGAYRTVQLAIANKV